MSPPPAPSRIRAIASRRCPRCLTGRVYQGIFRPNARCPDCGLLFEREPGYFLGSFYVSYGVGAVTGIPMVLVAIYLDLSFAWLFPLVAIWVAAFVPWIVSYSRVLWYHLDHTVDPR